MFLNPTVEPVRFASSWCLPPILFASIRTLIATYIFVSIITKLSIYAARGNGDLVGEDFSYFTALTNWGLAFYFAIASIHSWTLALKRQPALAKWGAVLQQFHSIFFTTIVNFSFVVTIVFWAILYSQFNSVFTTWTNVSQHALNSVFALFELIFSATSPPPWIHMLWCILLLGMYLGLAFVTYATQGFYVYAFLNSMRYSRGIIAAYIFGILALEIVVFIVVWVLIWFRRRFTERGNRSVSYANTNTTTTKSNPTEVRQTV